MRKKLFTFLLALATSVGLSWGQNPSGSCGTNLSWEFNPSTGTLTITGSGAMTDWASANSRPWHSYQSDITSLSLPEGLTFIGRSAFQECQMTSVELPNSLVEIGRAAFCACGLTSVTIPDNVQTIGQSAFASCQNLSTITIGSGVTSIGYFAFSNLMIEPWPSRKLESVTCYATTPPTCGFDESFTELWDKEQVPLYVPAESVDAYKAAEDWKDFDVQAISGGSTSSVAAARFVYNYDCQRDPAFPQAGSPCNLSGFSDPLVGYTGIGIRNKALGPWKLEFVGYYTPSNHYGCEYRVISAVNSYYPTLSDEEKEAKCLEVPIFRLWQYNLAEKEYQHASYGIVCAYAGEANAQDHAALFISSESWGCFLTGHQHTSSFQISCENDLTTGMADLVAAASAPSDPYYDVVWPVIVSIDAIGDVELTQFCKDQIEGSRAAYNALTDEQKTQVTNYSTLTDAEAEWADLVAAAQPYADAVIALINAIPDPVVYTQDCKDKIDAAQAAYDALTDGQKILVTNADKLPQAHLDYINAAPSVNIVFEADNSNIKKVEDVTLPRAFASGDASSEMVSILKELYNLDEEYTMGYASSNNDAVVISNSWSNKSWTVSPFDGTARVTGSLSKVGSWGPQSFTVYISLELPPFGPAPTPTDEEVPTNVDPDNSSYHYSTFFHSTQNYKLSNDGTQAFIADLSNNELVLTEIAHGEQVIPANTAVILRKTGSADPVVLIPTAESGVSVNPDDNDLRGVDEATTLESLSINPAQCYVLSGKSHDESESGVGFYKIYGNTLKAHKAYVIFAGGSNNAPKKMRFVYGQATGIENTSAQFGEAEKILENGQLFIIKNGVKYNAMGQVVK